MYILKNAIKNITRSKGRNILIGLIVLLLSVSACIALSIKEANKSLQKEYTTSKEITATISEAKKEGKDFSKPNSVSLEKIKSYGENKLVKKYYYTSNLYFSAADGIEPLDVSGEFSKNKDFKNKYGDIKNGESKTTTSSASSTASVTSTGNNNTSKTSVALLANSTANNKTENNNSTVNSNTDKNNTNSDSATKNESNFNNNSKNQNSNEPKNNNSSNIPNDNQNNNNNITNNNNNNNNNNTNGKTDKNNNQNIPQMPAGDTFITNQFFFNMGSMNDFTVVGASSLKALPDNVSSLNKIDFNSSDLNCVISSSLAQNNSLKVGSTFTLKNPNNESETYKFTVVGITEDTSAESSNTNTSSNASFTDNYIYISENAAQKIISSSAATNKSNTDNALTANYSGTYVFSNLNNYNAFNKILTEDGYSLTSQDIQNYEESINQLQTLGKYATYFIIVIFIIGTFVLVILNLFSIRSRKYEIGVLTAIGMKKIKVATQFVLEIFIVTFAALIIGSGIGAAVSVPVTNSLLTTINSTEVSQNNNQTNPPEFNNHNDNIENENNTNNSKENASATSSNNNGNTEFNNNNNKPTKPEGLGKKAQNYIASITKATDINDFLNSLSKSP